MEIITERTCDEELGSVNRPKKRTRARAGLDVWGTTLLPCSADACFSGESMPSTALLTDVTNMCICFFFSLPLIKTIYYSQNA